MALISLPMKIPPTSSPWRISQPNATSQSKLRPTVTISSPLFQHKLLLVTSAKSRNVVFRMRAVEEESKEKSKESEAEDQALGEEMKAAMMERKKKEENEGLLSGVAEEVEEIEWPAFGKVLGTTGVVLGVIAGSSVVLLTVNAVLAELSDRVFAGRGVQDFFG